MHQQRIEEASLNAWPALQLKLYDGWLLRYAKGYTKRANSVNVLSASTIDLPEKIAACERFYAVKGVPSVFRLNSFNVPPDLDQFLEQRGYRRVDETHVLSLELAGWRASGESTVMLRDEELPEWLNSYARLSSCALEHQQTHGEILDAIPAGRNLVSLAVDGSVVSCGLGVQEDDSIGLFDLVTDPDERGKGYGSALIGGLLQRAVAAEAHIAYLQVLASNSGARRLYERLGFRESYRYWYWVLAV
jgi:GNAT superfamily N-acetyltransferase